ncbi:MAG: N-acetyltransferase family protein [Methanolinea sp.]|nr:N-acetyltransferase family protein [Methanolinea sp.]
MVEFVPVTGNDLEEIAEIYNHYVEHTTAKFHSGKVSERDLGDFLYLSHPRYPSFLIREGGETIGFCFLSRYKNREAYDRSAELSIYLRPDSTGMGTGPICLDHLEKTARSAGIRVLVGTLCEENRSCIRLMEKAGFTRCAHLKHIGEKFGKILDVVMYEKEI